MLSPTSHPTLRFQLPYMRGRVVFDAQRRLSAEGFTEADPPDGVFGYHTDAAVRAFQRKANLKVDGVVGTDTWAKLFGVPVVPHPLPAAQPGQAPGGRRTLDDVRRCGYDFSSKVGTIEAIKRECSAQGLGLPAQIAYTLASIQHETGNTFRPVEEGYYVKDRKSYQKGLKYYPYYGRGFIQITWRENYDKFSKILGIDLIDNKGEALEPNISLFIAIYGLKHGSFTGKKLTDYINDTQTDFLNARRCINALPRPEDIKRAEHIKEIAEGWLRKLAIA